VVGPQRTGGTTLNPRSLNSLALWIQFPASAPCDASARPFKYACRRSHLRVSFGEALILDGLCLHVLSSFQRAGTACRPPPYSRSGRLKANLPTI